MAFNKRPRCPLPQGHGFYEGAPEPSAKLGRGTTGRGPYRCPPQLLNGDHFAMRYRPYSTARRRPVGRTLSPPDWSNIHLPTCRKDLYREHTRTAQRSPEEVDAYRVASEITITGGGVPKPILHVNEAGLPESVTKAIENLNSGSSPTALQAQCWPVALSGRDLVAVDCTASKLKSLAFLVPAVVHAQHQPFVLEVGGPTVLVLTVTRERALQFETVVQELSKGLGIRTMHLLSGEMKKPQLKQLEEGADICVATPYRLRAFMEEGKVDLGRCTFLAIDQADRMLKMGFGRNIRAIAENVRPDRQNIVRLTCATKESRELAREFTNDAVNVSVGAATEEQQNRLVEHSVIVCEKAKKENKLIALLKDIISDESDRAVVFVDRQETVEYIAWSLRYQALPVVGIHGKKTKQERQWALDALRSGKVAVLVTTDAAMRAVVLDNVRFVVSYDHPLHSSDHPHRVRHVARPDGTGRMCTFLAPDDHVRARELVRFFRENKQPLPPGLREVALQAARK